MSYVTQSQDPLRRATAVAGVVAVHAAVGAVLIAGLSFTGIIKVDDRPDTIFIPDTLDPPPPPEKDEIVPEVPKQDFIAPTPPLEFKQVTEIQPKEFDPVVPSDPVIPLPPKQGLIEQPKVQPGFAPKRAAPRNDASRWVLTDDYPSKALREGAEGVAGFRVVVGSDGRVDACEITRSSGNAQLDEATCKNVTRRARFDPATNGDGQKVVGSYSSTVGWQIPE